MEADLYKQKTWAHKIQAQEKNLSNIKIQILSDHKNSEFVTCRPHYKEHGVLPAEGKDSK